MHETCEEQSKLHGMVDKVLPCSLSIPPGFNSHTAGTKLHTTRPLGLRRDDPHTVLWLAAVAAGPLEH